MRLNRLLLAAAVVWAAAGFSLTFAPAEALAALGSPPGIIATWIAQLLGASLLALAVLNWMQRYSVTAGVLGRPVLLTNLMFATVACFASVGAWRQQRNEAVLAAAAVLGAVAASFAIRMLVAPRSVGEQ